MRLSPPSLPHVRLAAFRPVENAAAQRTPHFSVIRETPDPGPPDPINTSADLILPASAPAALKKKKKSEPY